MMTQKANSDLARTLWRLFDRFSGHDGPTVIRGVVSTEEASRFPHPWKSDEDNFQVALFSGPQVERTTDRVEASEKYHRKPRTRLYESVHTRRGEWPAVIASQLAAWLDADVLSSVYEAEANDAALPEHHDAWHNIVLQLEGSKRWRFTDEEVTLWPGDVLIVPTGVMHLVRTDSRSVHINFEVVNPDTVAEYMKNSTEVAPSA